MKTRTYIRTTTTALIFVLLTSSYASASELINDFSLDGRILNLSEKTVQVPGGASLGVERGLPVLMLNSGNAIPLVIADVPDKIRSDGTTILGSGFRAWYPNPHQAPIRIADIGYIEQAIEGKDYIANPPTTFDRNFFVAAVQRGANLDRVRLNRNYNMCTVRGIYTRSCRTKIVGLDAQRLAQILPSFKTSDNFIKIECQVKDNEQETDCSAAFDFTQTSEPGLTAAGGSNLLRVLVVGDDRQRLQSAISKEGYLTSDSVLEIHCDDKKCTLSFLKPRF